MRNRLSMLTKMADRLLKASEQKEAFNKSKERSERLKRLHNAISERYKFKVSRHENVSEIESDVKFLKLIEKTLTLTPSQENKLLTLFKRYGIN